MMFRRTCRMVILMLLVITIFADIALFIIGGMLAHFITVFRDYKKACG